jgi:hypothetical protein
VETSCKPILCKEGATRFIGIDSPNDATRRPTRLRTWKFSNRYSTVLPTTHSSCADHSRDSKVAIGIVPQSTTFSSFWSFSSRSLPPPCCTRADCKCSVAFPLPKAGGVNGLSFPTNASHTMRYADMTTLTDLVRAGSESNWHSWGH